MSKNQYVVNYKNEITFNYLNTVGTITYSSKVLNMLIIDSSKSLNQLLKLHGVTHAYQTKSRLGGIKR